MDERTAGQSHAQAGRAALGVDFVVLFEGLPTAYLVLTPQLVIAAANEAYLRLVGRTREELVGRFALEAFPPAPQMLDEHGANPLQLSLERARDSRQPDVMPLHQYDVLDPVTGQMVQRYWSLIHAPLLGDDGATELVVQRVEDVTDYVAERAAYRAERERDQVWRHRFEAVEADLYARAQQLRAALSAEEAASRRLAGLVQVALAVGGAQDVAELTDVVIHRGLEVLGADGGAVGVLTDEGILELTLTASLGEGAQRTYQRLAVDGDLPASVAASTGQVVLLGDRDASAGWSPGMAGALASTGLVAWASLPLVAGGRVLGSLTIGWREAQEFTDRDVQLMRAFAAQCAQALERIRHRDAEQRAAAAQRRIAETLQRSMLTRPVQPDHLQIAVRYQPAATEAQVGGDWYDAFLTAEGVTTIVVGDVAGHDREAAAAMGQVRNLLRGVAQTLGEPPAAVLSCLDEVMATLGMEDLATAVLAQVVQPPGAAEAGRRVLRWSNAGHLPPLLVHPDGGVELLERDCDLLLGMAPGTGRHDHSIDLAPGTTVLLYTDGLVERRDRSLEQGLQQLRTLVAELDGIGVEPLCDVLLEQLATGAEDDVALLAIRFHPEDRPRPPEAGPQVLPGPHTSTGRN